MDGKNRTALVKEDCTAARTSASIAEARGDTQEMTLDTEQPLRTLATSRAKSYPSREALLLPTGIHISIQDRRNVRSNQAPRGRDSGENWVGPCPDFLHSLGERNLSPRTRCVDGVRYWELPRPPFRGMGDTLVRELEECGWKKASISSAASGASRRSFSKSVFMNTRAFLEYGWYLFFACGVGTVSNPVASVCQPERVLSQTKSA
jgi:hypothetical protein